MLDIMKHFEKYASILMLVLMCVCIVLQVFFRYCLSYALEWPEEIARYAFICAVFLGASLAAEEGHHLEISVTKNLFGHKVKYVITIISTAATVLFCTMMTVWGIGLVIFIKKSGQIAASVDMEMYILYAVVPFSMFCMTIRTIVFTMKSLKQIRNGMRKPDDKYADMVNSW